MKESGRRVCYWAHCWSTWGDIPLRISERGETCLRVILPKEWGRWGTCPPLPSVIDLRLPIFHMPRQNKLQVPEKAFGLAKMHKWLQLEGTQLTHTNKISVERKGWLPTASTVIAASKLWPKDTALLDKHNPQDLLAFLSWWAWDRCRKGAEQLICWRSTREIPHIWLGLLFLYHPPNVWVFI